MSDKIDDLIKDNTDFLFRRVASILEQAKGDVVRSVNSSMVLAYWSIGREIVQEIQSGEERAEYGQQILRRLSEQLTARYGKGFSVTNLKYFRLFYLAYPDKVKPIGHPLGDQSTKGMLNRLKKKELMAINQKLSQGFSPQLSWSHYRALMRVTDEKARNFYEHEAIACGWSKTQLERQIHSSYYQRLMANQGAEGLESVDRERLPGEPTPAEQVLKSPYVLEFLGLPDFPNLHESSLEQAIIDNLQAFLLELGKGFSFVARQKHIRFDDDDFYVDLVFYNFMLKCFLLVDLKIGKLTHQDVGQMDGYVRLFEDRFKVPGDNPTIGLILCSDKSESVAKYSVLSEGRQIFAAKYLQYLPSEQELQLEIARERKLIESAMQERTESE